MQIFNSTKIILTSIFLFTSCVTTTQKEAMEGDIRHLENELNKLNERVGTQNKQMERATKVTISSQNDLQALQSQIQENAGDVDTLKLRLKKIEEISAQSSDRYNAKITANEQYITKLQRDVARLELLTPRETTNQATPPKKNSPNLKTAKDVEKFLKKQYEKGNFKELIQNATNIMESTNSNVDMIKIALEFRGEGKFQLGDYRGAAIDLSNYIEKYPNGEKQARAFLLAGDSYVYLRNEVAAMSYYNDCMKTYINTPEGNACESRLKK